MSDGDLAVDLPLLDSDHRQGGGFAKGSDVLGAIGAKASGTAAGYTNCDAGHRLKVIERIARGCLAGYDQATLK